jgi:protein-tyrosine-phosphatase
MIQFCFICSGNVCRSPFAEWRARAWLAEQGIDGMVSSCGTLRLSGDEAAPFTLKALQERGIDASEHRSRPMSYFLLREADWIICMEPHHEAAVRHELGGDVDLVKGGIHVITEFHPQAIYRNDAGIYDFVRADWGEYREGIDELEACLLNFLKEIAGTRA